MISAVDIINYERLLVTEYFGKYEKNFRYLQDLAFSAGKPIMVKLLT